MTWYMEDGPESEVAVSTRIRFARNISDINFIGTASIEDMKKVIEKFEKKQINPRLKLYKLEDMDEITKISLVERHVISPDIVNKHTENTAVILNDDESISIMLNEEDHLRIQIILSGLDLEKTLEVADKIDKDISKIVNYAWSDKYGYLTSCPTNVGTGMRASVMLHLPALTITGKISQVLDVVNKVGINVRGLYGEGTEALGNMYQVSNKISLGVSEKEIISNLKSIVEKIIEQEKNMRKILLKQGIDFEDRIYRAYGILINAKKLTSSECSKLISDVKLGVDMGIIKEIDNKKINELMVYIGPATLQKHYKKILSPEERDIARAKIIREKLVNKER